MNTTVPHLFIQSVLDDARTEMRHFVNQGEYDSYASGKIAALYQLDLIDRAEWMGLHNEKRFLVIRALERRAEA